MPGGCSVGAPAKLPKVRVGLIADDCILQNLWNPLVKSLLIQEMKEKRTRGKKVSAPPSPQPSTQPLQPPSFVLPPPLLLWPLSSPPPSPSQNPFVLRVGREGGCGRCATYCRNCLLRASLACLASRRNCLLVLPLGRGLFA